METKVAGLVYFLLAGNYPVVAYAICGPVRRRYCETGPDPAKLFSGLAGTTASESARCCGTSECLPIWRWFGPEDTTHFVTGLSLMGLLLFFLRGARTKS